MELRVRVRVMIRVRIRVIVAPVLGEDPSVAHKSVPIFAGVMRGRKLEKNKRRRTSK